MKGKILVLVSFCLAVLLSLPMFARTIIVTSPADSGPGSLRQAVLDARDGDTIEFAPGIEKIEMVSGEIVLDKGIEIRGPLAPSPAEQLVLDAKGASRLFLVVTPPGDGMPTVTISDMALTGGRVIGENGGAVLNAGNMKLLRCSIYGNGAHAGVGGGGNGGGISNSGTLDVEACTIYGNRAISEIAGIGGGSGGGIYNGWGGAWPVVPTVHLINSTVSGNEALFPAGSSSRNFEDSPCLTALAERSGLGGGIFNDTRPATGLPGIDSVPGYLELEQSTVTANTAHSGGGIANLLLMETGSEGPGEELGGALLIRGSIVGGNISALEDGSPDLLGDALALNSTIGSKLGNLGGRGNILGREAGLKPLADNGGATLTHALEPWSPAVNLGPTEPGHLLDQTGSLRVVAGRADSGALENSTPPLPLKRGSSAAFQDRDGDTVTISVKGPGEGYATVASGADAVDIVLSGTTDVTELEIETRGHTTVRNMVIGGPLKALRAPDADLLGSIVVEGGLKKLVLRDVIGPGEIITGVAPGQGAVLRFRDVRDLVLKTAGRIKEFEAASWEGSGDGAHDLLQADKIGQVTITGWARKLKLFSDGDIEKLKVGGFEKSFVFAGAVPGLMCIADPLEDFAGDGKIKNFTVTGAVKDAGGASFSDGILGSRAMGEISLGTVSVDEQNPTHGLSSLSIKDLRYTIGGQPFHLKNLENYSQSVRSGRFTVSLDSTADLGFSFAALDDTRSDLWLPGVALQHLGFLFKNAALDHCRFVLVPGDFATGYMGLCMSESTCDLFDPKGSISKGLSDIQYPEFVSLAALFGYNLGDGVNRPTTLFPTRGNHECYLKGDLTRSQWTNYVGRYLPQNGPKMGSAPDENPEMDERGFTYSFSYRNCMFLGIDEYAALNDKDNGFDPPSSTQVPSVMCNGWVSEQVAAFKADPTLNHLFAFGHSPLYRIQMDTSMDATSITAAGRDSFVSGTSGSLEVYFCGHEHFYDHTIINGTTLDNGTGIDAMHQVLVGTGGADIDLLTEDDCHYSASYIRDPARQFYHNPEVPASGNPVGCIGYNLVTVSGADVDFLWKAWRVDNPCTIAGKPVVPCGLCPTCSVDATPVIKNSWSYSVTKR